MCQRVNTGERYIFDFGIFICGAPLTALLCTIEVNRSRSLCSPPSYLWKYMRPGQVDFFCITSETLVAGLY